MADPEIWCSSLPTRPKVVNEALGASSATISVRRLGPDRSADRFSFLWVTRFPMFEFDEAGKALPGPASPLHLAPLEEDYRQALTRIPLAVQVPRLRSGAERFRSRWREHSYPPARHCRSGCVQDAGHVRRKTTEDKFGFLLDRHWNPVRRPMAASRFRVRPAGDAAVRRESSIRDVIAFPKTQKRRLPADQCPV
jgi:aspartyl-tRNA synthetase